MTVTNSTFSSNSANGVVGYGGGGIYNDYGTVNVTNSTFSDNNTTNNGGGIYCSSLCTLNVTNSTFSSNETTGGHGGGIYNKGNMTTVTNSTFYGNIAGGVHDGGGIYSDSGTLNVTNSTLSGNSAPWGTGGGIYNNDTNSTATVQNTIIANFYMSTNCGGTLGGANNLTDDNSCGSGFTNSSSIRLGTLGNYGGSTQTFPLSYNSVAIDAADSAHCPTLDQRGQPRNDLQCDVGAYEMQMSDRNNTQLNPGSTMRTFGPPRFGIQYSGTDPGTTTVAKVTNWTSQPATAIGVWWDITPTTGTGLNLTLKFCYSTTELRGLTESNLRFWRYSGGSLSQVGGAPTLSGSSPNRCAQISGVTDLSRWTLATGNPGNAPTAVTLSSFDAQVGQDSILPYAFSLVALAGAGWLVWRKRAWK